MSTHTVRRIISYMFSIRSLRLAGVREPETSSAELRSLPDGIKRGGR